MVEATRTGGEPDENDENDENEEEDWGEWDEAENEYDTGAMIEQV